jgi:acyl-CoA reductase-like NAD-dependent aldehyde dehydrogenase
MGVKNYKMYIKGQWSRTGGTFADYNPASGELWAEIPDGTRKDAKKAIEAAAAAQAEWATMPHPQRAGYLLKVADILEKRQMDIVNALIDEAAALANNSEYGLSAGIITRDEEKGLSVARRLQTGMAHVNCSSVNDEPHVPFGGVKSSGIGRHGGKASVDAFTESRWLTLERGGRQYPPPFVVAP